VRLVSRLGTDQAVEPPFAVAERYYPHPSIIERLTYPDSVPLDEDVRFELCSLDKDRISGEMEDAKIIAVKWPSTSNPAATREIISLRPIGRRIFLESTPMQACYIWWNATCLSVQEAFRGGLCACGGSDAQMRDIEAPEIIIQRVHGERNAHPLRTWFRTQEPWDWKSLTCH